VPGLAATLQAWHEGQLAVPQQTPSTQLPLAHWSAAAQVSPAAFFGWQLPAAPVQ
jgi:hypothetical protein